MEENMKLSRPIWTLLVIIFLLPIGVATNVASGGGGDDDPGLADLVPAFAPGSTLYHFDTLDTGIVLYVLNQGTATAQDSHVSVTFSLTGGEQTIQATGTTGTLAPSTTSSNQIFVEIPSGCFNVDCNFTINVDSLAEVQESNENNNSVDETIVG